MLTEVSIPFLANPRPPRRHRQANLIFGADTPKLTNNAGLRNDRVVRYCAPQPRRSPSHRGCFMRHHDLIGSPLSRRSFLRVGALGLGGLTLPALLRAEAASGV